MSDMRRNRTPAFMRQPVSVHMPAPVVNVLPEIMMKPKSDGEVWLEVLTAVISKTKSMDDAIDHADDVLEVYRSRFK